MPRIKIMAHEEIRLLRKQRANKRNKKNIRKTSLFRERRCRKIDNSHLTSIIDNIMNTVTDTIETSTPIYPYRVNARKNNEIYYDYKREPNNVVKENIKRIRIKEMIIQEVFEYLYEEQVQNPFLDKIFVTIDRIYSPHGVRGKVVDEQIYKNSTSGIYFIAYKDGKTIDLNPLTCKIEMIKKISKDLVNCWDDCNPIQNKYCKMNKLRYCDIIECEKEYYFSLVNCDFDFTLNNILLNSASKENNGEPPILYMLPINRSVINSIARDVKEKIK